MPPLAAVPNLDRDLDKLYGLPLDAWTAARNDLASRLKKAHQDEDAAAVRALRKPSIVTWLVNQLARREKSAVGDLLRAGERLRAAQTDALRGRGGAEDVGAAAAAERLAVRQLVTVAAGLLKQSGRAATQTTLDRVAQTLRAAAVDEQARPLLERGRLDAELQGSGFGALAGVAPASRPRSDRADAAREAREARERVKELRVEARRLDRAARTADEVATQVERDAERLRGEAAAAREEAERAATELAEAEALARRLRR